MFRCLLFTLLLTLMFTFNITDAYADSARDISLIEASKNGD